MSYEFRETCSSFLWAALNNARDDVGDHEISQLLVPLYEALSYLEKDCAAVEAGDSSDYCATLGLQSNFPAIEAAFNQIKKRYNADKALIEEIVRVHVDSPKTKR